MPRQRENWKFDFQESRDYARGPVSDALFSGLGASMSYGDETLVALLVAALNSATNAEEQDRLVKHYSVFKRDYLGQTLDYMVDEVNEARGYTIKHATLEAKFDALVKRIAEDAVPPTLQQATAEADALRAASEERTERLKYLHENIYYSLGLIETLQMVEEKLQKPFQDGRAPDTAEAYAYAEETQNKIPALLEAHAAWRANLPSVAELVENRRLRDFRDYLKKDGVATARDLEAPAKATFPKKGRSFG